MTFDLTLLGTTYVQVPKDRLYQVYTKLMQK